MKQNDIKPGQLIAYHDMYFLVVDVTTDTFTTLWFDKYGSDIRVYGKHFFKEFTNVLCVVKRAERADKG